MWIGISRTPLALALGADHELDENRSDRARSAPRCRGGRRAGRPWSPYAYRCHGSRRGTRSMQLMMSVAEWRETSRACPRRPSSPCCRSPARRAWLEGARSPLVESVSHRSIFVADHELSAPRAGCLASAPCRSWGSPSEWICTCGYLSASSCRCPRCDRASRSPRAGSRSGREGLEALDEIRSPRRAGCPPRCRRDDDAYNGASRPSLCEDRTTLAHGFLPNRGRRDELATSRPAIKESSIGCRSNCRSARGIDAVGFPDNE